MPSDRVYPANAVQAVARSLKVPADSPGLLDAVKRYMAWPDDGQLWPAHTAAGWKRRDRMIARAQSAMTGDEIGEREYHMEQIKLMWIEGSQPPSEQIRKLWR